MPGLTGRVAVVTGGARGFGRAIVHGLLAGGARVVALDRSWDGVDASALRGQDVLLAEADVTDESALADAYERTIAAFGTVDVIVNNAGYRQRDVAPSAVTRALDVPTEHWLRMLAVNAVGLVLVTRHFVPAMLDKRSGSVINVTSRAGQRGRPGDQPYGASKAAADNLSQTLAAELSDQNIAVNIVYPPSGRTTGYEEQNRLRREQTGRTRTDVPWKPESIVPVVVFLAGLRDSRLTGRAFAVTDWNLEHGLGGVEVWGSPEP
jgi:NAD(P)-dependent dehydrogenase (short-subunit alcohol dehydrogenase family)